MTIYNSEVSLQVQKALDLAPDTRDHFYSFSHTWSWGVLVSVFQVANDEVLGLCMQCANRDY